MKKLVKTFYLVSLICIIYFFCDNLCFNNFIAEASKGIPFSLATNKQLTKDFLSTDEKEVPFVNRERISVPFVKKVPIGGEITNSNHELVDEMQGKKINLRKPLVMDTSKIGFQAVKKVVSSEDSREVAVPISVNVYNPKTTIFNDQDALALDVKNIQVTKSEIEAAIQNNQLNELIINKSEADFWQMTDGGKLDISITSQIAQPQIGKYEVMIRGTKKDTNKIVEKKISLLVVNSELGNGWEIGSSSDSIGKVGNKINWNSGNWWYTSNGASWIYNTSIEATLIINGSFLAGTNENTKGGFLWANPSDSLYTKNLTTNTLKRSFLYKDYQIDISQKILEDGAVEVSYQVINNSLVAQKIGVSQYVDLVDVSPPSVSVINDFKGFNMVDRQPVVVMPDPETMPNWVVSPQSTLKNFKQYSSQTVDGAGWETKKQYWNGAKRLDPPLELKEGQPKNDLGDLGVAMKNPGVMVQPGEGTTFKQIIKFGGLIAPELSLDQEIGTMYTDESVDITGIVSDADSQSYRLYLEMDDLNKTLIPLQDYFDIPNGEKQTFNVKIKGELFNQGEHVVSVIAIDEYGSRSGAKKINLTIKELSATPKIQKIEVGQPLSSVLSELFTNIKGVNIALKDKVTVDTANIGFYLVEATLIANKEKELTLKIPVNVYDPISTVYDEKNNIMLDAKNTTFNVVDVREAEEKNKLSDFVIESSVPKSWDMKTGVENEVTLTLNGLTSKVGTYKSQITAKNKTTNQMIQKEIVSTVGGDLKFKSVPSEVGFLSRKVSDSEGYIQRKQENLNLEIENTLGSNWSLYISAYPLINEHGDILKNALIFKSPGQADRFINSSNLKVQTGEAITVYPKIQWASKEGPLLKISPGLKVGNYKGELNWILSNAP